MQRLQYFIGVGISWHTFDELSIMTNLALCGRLAWQPCSAVGCKGSHPDSAVALAGHTHSSPQAPYNGGDAISWNTEEQTDHVCGSSCPGATQRSVGGWTSSTCMIKMVQVSHPLSTVRHHGTSTHLPIGSVWKG